LAAVLDWKGYLNRASCFIDILIRIQQYLGYRFALDTFNNLQSIPGAFLTLPEGDSQRQGPHPHTTVTCFSLPLWGHALHHLGLVSVRSSVPVPDAASELIQLSQHRMPCSNALSENQVG
jgi:hypothetical protein